MEADSQTPELVSGIPDNIYVILSTQCRFRLNMYTNAKEHIKMQKKIANSFEWDFLSVEMGCLHLPTNRFDSHNRLQFFTFILGGHCYLRKGNKIETAENFLMWQLPLLIMKCFLHISHSTL